MIVINRRIDKVMVLSIGLVKVKMGLTKFEEKRNKLSISEAK